MIEELLIMFIARLATTEVDQDVMEAVVVDDDEVSRGRLRQHTCRVGGMSELVAYIEGAQGHLMEVC